MGVNFYQSAEKSSEKFFNYKFSKVLLFVAGFQGWRGGNLTLQQSFPRNKLVLVGGWHFQITGGGDDTLQKARLNFFFDDLTLKNSILLIKLGGVFFFSEHRLKFN